MSADKASNAKSGGEIPSGDKIQKTLATLGLGSRREIESWIKVGRVIVNGEAAHIGQRITERDRVEVDGKRVQLHGGSAPQVIILNKTAGVVCSRRDPEGRRTVFEDLPELRKGRWISIGRLDMQTTGLLLLTTDGELANRMMHPSTGLDREYAVRVNGRLDDETVEQLKIGIDVDGEMLSFSDVQYYDGTDNNAWYHVVLMEGKNREVRRLFEAVGCTVSRLKRVRYGPVILPSWLKNRQWAVLRPEDMKDLYKLLGLRYVTPKNDRKGPTRRTRLAKTTCLLPYPKLG